VKRFVCVDKIPLSESVRALLFVVCCLCFFGVCFCCLFFVDDVDDCLLSSPELA